MLEKDVTTSSVTPKLDDSLRWHCASMQVPNPTPEHPGRIEVHRPLNGAGAIDLPTLPGEGLTIGQDHQEDFRRSVVSPDPMRRRPRACPIISGIARFGLTKFLLMAEPLNPSLLSLIRSPDGRILLFRGHVLKPGNKDPTQRIIRRHLCTTGGARLIVVGPGPAHSTLELHAWDSHSNAPQRRYLAGPCDSSPPPPDPLKQH